MRIIIGADKAGFELKEFVVEHLGSSQHAVTNLGPMNAEERVSFVNMADVLCKKLLQGKADRGILVCGTGMGMSLAANKHKGIYAAVVESTYTARLSRLINNANVLCMGGFVLARHRAFEIVDVFLETKFLQDFEQWRVDFLNSQLDLLKEIEEENYK